MSDFKVLVELGGGRYVGRRGNSVLFSDPEDGHLFTLYVNALRSPEDVRLALKSHREDLADPWAPTNRVTT